MPHKFVLDKNLAERVVSLADEVRVAAEEHREAFNERSETWQNSDDGTTVDAWIEALENTADDMDNIRADPFEE